MSTPGLPRDNRIEARGISKHFGGTQALSNVTVSVRVGSVHALVGENGAGKSTLGKIIAGVLAPDEGQLLVRGGPVSLRSPREALEHGIATIGQEPSVVPHLSVAENVFLGAEPRSFGTVRRRALRKRYELLVGSAGFDLRGDVPAGALPIAGQQEVEILRALSRAAEVVIMDEPTAALSAQETTRLHEIVKSLAAQGKTILLISHFLREVLELADTVTVLRDGRVVCTTPAADQTEASLVEAMLGQPLALTFPPKRVPHTDAPVVLSAKGVQAPGVAGVDLMVRAGEIVGLAGLVGAGRSELGQAIFGASPMHGGEVELNGILTHGWAAEASPCRRRPDPGVAEGRGPHPRSTRLRECEPREPRGANTARRGIAAARAGSDARDPRAVRRSHEEQQFARA